MEILAVTIPIFLFVLIGYVARKKGLIGEETKQFISKIVYYLALPALAFRSIVSFDFASTFKLNLVAVNVLGTTIMFVITFFLAFLIRDHKKRGAFNMSCFRSNMGYMGLPLAEGFYGSEAVSKTAVINGFDSPLVILLSVFALEIYRGGQKKSSKFAWEMILKKLLDFITNPFVFSAVLGLIFSYYQIPVLKFTILDEFLRISGNIALPLALISIGCSLQPRHIKENGKLVAAGLFFKLLVAPAVAFFLAYVVFGLRGADLGLSVMLLGTPTSVSSYIMACEMESDAELSAALIGTTTFTSVISITIIQVVLRLFGAI